MDLVKEYVDKLLNSFNYVKTIDGFLIKLSTIAYDIEDKCSDGACNPVVLFREVIENDRLSEFLSRFSCYAGDIESLIRNDPRHKILRKYLEIIVDRLSSLKCIDDRKYDTLVPTPTWLKERYSETISVGEELKPELRRVSAKSILSIDNLWKILFIISVLIIIISLIIIFVKR